MKDILKIEIQVGIYVVSNAAVLLCRHTTLLTLQSNQIKRTPQDSISELIIWKMNPLDVPVTGVKFKAAFLHA